MTRQPVAVFDSGVGGLSVLREIRRELPHEDLLYAADSGYAPYGDKPPEYVTRRVLAVAEFLAGEGAKTLVVACNTATGVAVDALRARFALPVVAIEPAVKPAVAHTRSGVVGVLGTALTLSSSRFDALLRAHGADARVLIQPCPGLVEHVERGELDAPATSALLERYVRPLVDGGADTLVLGCTHYAFLEPAIRRIAGASVTVLDPAPAVARELRRRLAAAGLLTDSVSPGTERFWTTGSVSDVKRTVTLLWPGESDVAPDVRHVEL